MGAADHPPFRPEVLDSRPGSSHPRWVLSASFLHTLKTSPWLFLATPLPAAPGWALSHSAGQGLQDPHTLVPVSSSWPSEGVCTAWVLRPRERGAGHQGARPRGLDSVQGALPKLTLTLHDPGAGTSTPSPLRTQRSCLSRSPTHGRACWGLVLAGWRDWAPAPWPRVTSWLLALWHAAKVSASSPPGPRGPDPQGRRALTALVSRACTSPYGARGFPPAALSVARARGAGRRVSEVRTQRPRGGNKHPGRTRLPLCSQAGPDPAE